MREKGLLRRVKNDVCGGNKSADKGTMRKPFVRTEPLDATLRGHTPGPPARSVKAQSARNRNDRLTADRKTAHRFVPVKLAFSLTARSDSRNGRIFAALASRHTPDPPQRHLDIFLPSYPLHPLRQT